MFAPRVYVSMIFALVFFAIVTFVLTGSAWTTFWQTLICAVILQAGYFIAVFGLVLKADRDRRKMASRPSALAGAAPDEKEPKAVRVPSNPGHFNS